ncbi:MAG: hypothetical protein K8W52_06220 [Deltaproteobacteria bacterium]|nr:hypothetical protein [Deltaproteobacteria bacterium]
MRGLGLIACALLASCNSILGITDLSSGSTDDARPDGAAIDAADVDAAAVSDAPSAVDAATDGQPDANLGACNVANQAACGTGLMCSPARPAGTQTVDPHCVAAGSLAAGAACTAWGITDPATSFEHDTCAPGLFCQSGTCQPLCVAPNGTCPSNMTCSLYAGLASDNSVGLCTPMCDPVSQVRLTDNAAKCGSVQTPPERECVGTPDGPFLCAGTIAGHDTFVQGTSVAPPIYLNSCAAGFAPIFTDPATSGNARCTAFCRPASTSSAMTGNAKGVVGSGFTCPNRNANSAECRFVWSYQSNIGVSPHFDNVGVCFDFALYGAPSCTTLTATADLRDNGCVPE